MYWKNHGKDDNRVYINEHLIVKRAEILSKARKLVKEHKLQGAWTKNGAIFVKISDLPDSRPIRVNDLKELPQG